MPLPDFLIDRYIDWKNNYFEKNKLLYKKTVSEGQKPKVMVISCCDSRVQATSIFGSNIGEFFVHRNIANLVPPYNLGEENSGTSSAIEYAVKTLKVSHIIILGHSNCGGIKYGYQLCCGEKNNDYEFIDKWLKILKTSFHNLNSNLQENDKIKFLEKESIKNFFKNLKSYPFIDLLIQQKKITIHGLWHDISEGLLMELNSDNYEFEKIIHE